jgi:TATA-binding protein-associated factor
LAVAYAKEDASELTPRFTTLDEWEPLKSTKMDACARVCAHYLKHDHVDDVRFEEGELIFPDVLEIPGAKLPRRRRIIIYSEFPSMAPLLQNVGHLHF